MKTLLYSLVPLVLISALHAQAPQKYSVLKTEKGDAYLASLNQLADQGYRVLAVSKYTILRLDAAPPDTYRYLRLELKGGPAQFTNWVNDQGAHGYRWLPRTGLLEKSPHPRNYEYRFSLHGALGPSKGGDLSSLIEQGFRPVEITSFPHAIGASTEEMFFERELGQPSPPPRSYPGTSVAVADAMRADNVMKRVDELAKKGYRILGPHDSSKGGGIAVMMERCPVDCAGRYEYRYFDAKDAAQVERDLNSLGKDGFRVVPSTLQWRPHVLERDTQARPTFSYRALDPPDAAGLASQLNAPDQEGYAPIDFVWHAGWTAQGFLILEKEATSQKEAP